MPALFGRVAGQHLPRDPLAIDWGHPLAQGLVFLPHMETRTDLVTGARASSEDLTLSHVSGYAFRPNSSFGWVEWSHPQIGGFLAGRSALTLAFLRWNADAPGQPCAPLNLCNANGSSYWLLQNGGDNRAGVYTSGGLTTSSNNQTGHGLWEMWVASLGPGGGHLHRIFNGAIIESASVAAISPTQSDLSRIRIGNERGSSTAGAPAANYASRVDGAWVWNRQLTFAEVQQLARTPFCMLRRSVVSRPRSAKLPTSTVTATMAAAWGGHTGAASATINHAATATGPWGGLSAATSGTVTHSATASGPWGGLDASTAAVVDHPATATGAWGGIASSAAAVVGHTVTAAGAWGELTGSASATVTRSAAMSGTWGALAGATSAAVTHSASATGAWDALVATATFTGINQATMAAAWGGLAAAAQAWAWRISVIATVVARHRDPGVATSTDPPAARHRDPQPATSTDGPVARWRDPQLEEARP